MSVIIRIPRNKLDELSENVEQGLRYLGKAMQCVDSLSRAEDDHYGERGGMNYRYPTMGMREREPWMGDRYPEDPMGMRDREPWMGERRRDYRGRFM